MPDVVKNKEPDFADFLAEIWSARLGIFIGLLIGAFIAFSFIAVSVPHYEARIVLAPADPMNMTTQDDGQDQASSHDLNFVRFEAGFKGADVARLLLRDPEITDGLAEDQAFTFSETEQGWSPSKLASYIAKRVEIDPIGETPLRIFSYAHPDPVFAVQFLSRLHNVTDGLIRHEMRRGVNERIAYLNAALGTTNNPEHRRAMTDLLMEQERLKMLVSIDQSYAASVVVKAAASAKPVWPDRILVYLGFCAIGAFMGFVVMSLGNAFAARGDDEGFLPSKVEQQDWFFPESGNNNEKPIDKTRKPLTDKKPAKRQSPSHDASDAAE